MRKLPFPRYTRFRDPLSRSERFARRLSIGVSLVLHERLDEAGRKTGRVPLVAILRDLGYRVTPAHPYGQTKQRENLILALDWLAISDQWVIRYEDTETDIWVTYSRPKTRKRRLTSTPAQDAADA